jgi:DNA (cytosine-5)-methyltransferase 1
MTWTWRFRKRNRQSFNGEDMANPRLNAVRSGCKHQITAAGKKDELMPTFYEFFAGGGMARSGLGEKWTCLFANDFNRKKVNSYRENWKDDVVKFSDVAELSTRDLPDFADLAWASFPCQDLSLAGNYLGLSGDKSGAFWPFWRLIRGLGDEGRIPSLIVLENVCGALTSHGGEDFRSLISALRSGGYRMGAVVVDAALFVPQSRPRLFIIGIQAAVPISPELTLSHAVTPFHTPGVQTAYHSLSKVDQEAWVWWNLPVPDKRQGAFIDLIEDEVPWDSNAKTDHLLNMMLPLHKAKVRSAMRLNKRVVGAIYKRTRPDESGRRAQRAEVRFDDVAGCLRTPGGGSSRQSILIVEGTSVRSRLLTSREAARLMGVDEQYVLPKNYNDAYHLMGDAVVVPVVNHLANNLLTPLVEKAALARNERLTVEVSPQCSVEDFWLPILPSEGAPYEGLKSR